MARSLKKGPFADASLLKKVDAMNASGSKAVIKTWSRHRCHLIFHFIYPLFRHASLHAPPVFCIMLLSDPSSPESFLCIS